jgi:hypothetical protein
MPETMSRVRDQVEKWLVNPEYCGAATKITAKASKPLAAYDIVGVPVIANNVIAAAGDEASVIGIVLPQGTTKLTLAAEAQSVDKYFVLNRGPATIAKSGLPTLDPVGGSYNLTTLATRLLTLGILVVTSTELENTIEI